GRHELVELFRWFLRLRARHGRRGQRAEQRRGERDASEDGHSDQSSERYNESTRARCSSRRTRSRSSSMNRIRKAVTQNQNGIPMSSGSLGITVVFGWIVRQ